MQFDIKNLKCARLTVRQVETEYSWALMQAVLLAFKKENIITYLEKCFAICQGRKFGWPLKGSLC